jgi:hypothetical protein
MTGKRGGTGGAAGAAKQSANRGAQHERLDIFVGRWNTKGQQYEGPVGPAAKITAVEAFEWLTGGFFLVHRFEGRVGDGEAACIEIIGPDAGGGSYRVHSFYNNGITNQWQSRERDGTWTLTGDWPMEGQSMKVRCTIVFSDAGDTMTGKWEHSSDGSSWRTFWDVKATKEKEK